MNHKPWTITAKSSSEIEILLYEMIGMDFWSGEGTTAKSFAEDLKAAGDGVRKIHLRVNSPGGNVFDGLAIYNTLLNHGAKITASVDGLAASIASVITMAAEEISMGDNAIMMIHNPSTVVGGDAPEMRKMADVLDKVKTLMITAYRRHTSKSIAEVGAIMDAETWMTAQETVDAGFAELVTTPEGDEEDVAANFAPIFAKFRHVPAQIAARFSGSVSRTKRVDGENLTSNCFIYVGDEEDTSTWHLPWHFAEEEKTKSHLRDALARFDQTDIPASEKSAARSKLIRLCKEHGITVADKDKKAAKALARLAAVAKECLCTCDPCLDDDCGNCVNEDCRDDNCEDCPMPKVEAHAGVSEAGARSRNPERSLRRISPVGGKKKAPVDPMICACDCSACSASPKDCANCVNADCTDENCEDCPMQDKSASALTQELAQVRRQLAVEVSAKAAARDQVKLLQAQMDRQSAANRAAAVTGAADRDIEVRWQKRVSATLEQSTELYATGTAELTRRCLKAQALHGRIRARVASAAELITQIKAVRTAEVTTLGQWTGRAGEALQQSATLGASARQEIQLRSKLQGELQTRIEAVGTLLEQLKGERAEELTALTTWTGRAQGELERSSTLQGSAAEAIGRQSKLQAELQTKLAGVETLLGELEKQCAAEVAALVSWTGRLSAELREAATLHSSAVEEVAGCPGVGTGVARAARIEAVESLLGKISTERNGEIAVFATWMGRVHKDLEQAASLEAGALAEMRALPTAAPEAMLHEIDAAAKTLSALKTERAAELAATSHWTKRVLAELAKSGESLAGMLKDVTQRSHAAEQVARDTQAHLERARTAKLPSAVIQMLEAESTMRGEEASALLAWTKSAQEGLQASLQLQASAVEEIAHRSRLAESAAETGDRIADVESLLPKLKTEWTAGTKASADLIERISSELTKAGKLEASALEELTRRSHLAEGSEMGAHLETAVGFLRELKTAISTEVTAVAEFIKKVGGVLEQSGKLQAPALEEITRRSHQVESSELGTQLKAAATTLGECKTARAAEVVAVAESAARVLAELKEAAKLNATVLEEISRRASAAEASRELASHLEEAVTALTQCKSERSAEVTAVAEAATRVLAQLEASGKLQASVSEELTRRVRLAESGELGTQLEAVEGLLTQLETTTAGNLEAIDSITADLKRAGDLYSSAVEEIARRARLAELAPAAASS